MHPHPDAKIFKFEPRDAEFGIPATMNTQIILAGLKARPVRTGVGILAVTLEVVLILLLVGLTNGAIADSGSRVAGVGG